MTQQLRSVAAVSCAKVFAILYGFIGLVMGVLFSMFFLFAEAIGRSSAFPSGPGRGAAGLLLGVGSIIFFPICYAVFGAIGGLIMAALYNVVAKYFGGIEMEIG